MYKSDAPSTKLKLVMTSNDLSSNKINNSNNVNNKSESLIGGRDPTDYFFSQMTQVPYNNPVIALNNAYNPSCSQSNSQGSEKMSVDKENKEEEEENIPFYEENLGDFGDLQFIPEEENHNLKGMCELELDDGEELICQCPFVRDCSCDTEEKRATLKKSKCGCPMEGCNSKYYIPDMVNGRANLGLEEDAPMPCRICVQKREQERKKSEQERRRTEDESSQNLVANNNNNDGHLIISD
jgi:hypothetical protein